MIYHLLITTAQYLENNKLKTHVEAKASTILCKVVGKKVYNGRRLPDNTSVRITCVQKEEDITEEVSDYLYVPYIIMEKDVQNPMWLKIHTELYDAVKYLDDYMASLTEPVYSANVIDVKIESL